MIGTPSQYKKEKMFGKPPDSLPKGSYFLRTPEGSLYVKPYEDQYVIRDVFVTEDQRGKGFGRKMMSDILEFLLPKKKEDYSLCRSSEQDCQDIISVSRLQV